MSYEQLTVVLNANQKGGSGKTTITDGCHAVASAAGLSTLIVDVDDGNNGITRRIGKADVIPLDWLIDPQEALPWAHRHLTNRDLAIFDLGANLLASGAPVTQFLGVLIPMLKAGGARILFFAVASPNAPGTDRLVRSMRDDFEELGEVRLVENNLDGSGEFPPSLTTVGLKKIDFSRIDPGIQAARLRRQEPLLDVLRQPEPDHRLAMGRYAAYIHQFATQEHARDIFGEAGILELERLGASAPPPTAYIIVMAKHATDEAIFANVALRQARLRLLDADREDRDGVFSAALDFIEADRRYRAF